MNPTQEKLKAANLYENISITTHSTTAQERETNKYFI